VLHSVQQCAVCDHQCGITFAVQYPGSVVRHEYLHDFIQFYFKYLIHSEFMRIDTNIFLACGRLPQLRNEVPFLCLSALAGFGSNRALHRSRLGRVKFNECSLGVYGECSWCVYTECLH
jgi:hypothetical protein